MRLTKYSCKNYARLQDFEITVRDNLFIVGANDVGKSSLLCTMDWLLGFSHSRLYATVQQSDFRDLSESLILEATLDSLSDIELAAFPDEVTVGPVGGAITLALRMVAEFDDLGETISIQRFAPDSGRIRNLSPSQLEMLGWSLLGATSKARDIRGTRQAGMGELLESVDLGADKIEFNSLNQQFAQL
uniref:AAA family ATPase n=1 Tax=Corynebacterium stationis TaxID=1705 RepID=UPI00260A05F5